MRSIHLTGICAALLCAALALGYPAWADTLLLENGDYVRGELQLVDLAVTTSDGVVRVRPAEIWEVSLSGIGGDVVAIRDAGKLTGRIDAAAYSIRLRSGQTLVFSRHEVGRILFHRR